MITCCKSYDWWIDKIEAEEPWTFVRYGDGELNAMFWTNREHGGGRTKNGDGHTLRNKELRADLRQSILQPGDAPNYYRSLWMDGNCQPKERLALDHLPTLAPSVTWYNALAIHFANVMGNNYRYFEAMRTQHRPVVVIGPKHLRYISRVGCFEYTGFIEVPYKNSYFVRERVIAEALRYPPNTLYSIHTGPSSPVIAWMLWMERGDTCAALDLGSILDGYVHERYGGPVKSGAALTRSFWRKRASKELLKRNLEGA